MKVKDVIKKEVIKTIPVIVVTAAISVFLTNAHCQRKIKDTTINLPSSNVGILKVWDNESQSVKEYEGKIIIESIDTEETKAIYVEMGDAKQISETKYNYIGTK